MKRGLKLFFIILGGFILLALIFFAVDYTRVNNQEKPIFCIKNPAGTILDGGAVEYFGLGYKVIDFNTLVGFDDIKIGTWFMKYEDFLQEDEKTPIVSSSDCLEVTGENIKSAIKIDGEDYKAIVNILNNQNYTQEICKCSSKYIIKLNNGLTYYVKSNNNNEIAFGKKQAKLTDSDFRTVEDIITKHINSSNNSRN